MKAAKKVEGKTKKITKPKGKHKPKPGQDDLEDRICQAIASNTLGLKWICKQNPDFPTPMTIFRWLADDEKKDFRYKYARAKEQQAELIADEILSIADDGSNDFMTIVRGDESYEVENKELTNRSKLRVQARQWLLSKILPKKYGDKLELAGDPENPINHVVTGMVVK